MRLFLTTIILTMLAQPVLASCDLAEPDGFCETSSGGWVRFATGEGRFLSEAYCSALGALYPDGGKEVMSSTITEHYNGDETELFESSAEITVCDLRVVTDDRLEFTTSADGVINAEIDENTVTITRGMSHLTCGYKYETSAESETGVELFDEAQNFYSDLIHPANPPNCGPEERFRILETTQIDDGRYWSVKVAHRFNRSSN